ncbi:hypothetical protein [Shimia thalassica]|uniref:hypothetical protein n=1 Tax=Shimia thalassica TaxID=1715693 RepID=UPI0026E2854F|nr:hypothetical protein [Shimia thalassica]MDO6799353.1 hypothetical protein [Shimia thalassica]
MSTVNFQLVPAQTGGATAEANPLTDIRLRTAVPEGAFKTWLERLGHPFDHATVPAFMESRIARTYQALNDAGILDVLDWLYISNGDLDYSLVNWISGGGDALNFGATMSGGSFHTDGVATYLEANMAANVASRDAPNFTLEAASVFVFLTAEPANPAEQSTTPIIGAPLGVNSDRVRLHRNPGSPHHQLRLNGISDSTMNTGGITDDDWTAGLWSVTRATATTVEMHKGATLMGTVDNVAADSLVSACAVGAGGSGDTFGAQSFTAFGGGGILTDDQRAILNDTLTQHSDEIVLNLSV